MKTYTVMQYLTVGSTVQRFLRDEDRIFAINYHEADIIFAQRFKKEEGYVLYGELVEEMNYPTILDFKN